MEDADMAKAVAVSSEAAEWTKRLSLWVRRNSEVTELYNAVQGMTDGKPVWSVLAVAFMLLKYTAEEAGLSKEVLAAIVGALPPLPSGHLLPRGEDDGEADGAG